MKRGNIFLTGLLLICFLLGSSALSFSADMINDYALLNGKISGYCYNDENGNGIRDAGEEGVSGVAVSLKRLYLMIFPREVGSAETSADGTYEFTNLGLGFYSVEVKSTSTTECKTKNPALAYIGFFKSAGVMDFGFAVTSAPSPEVTIDANPKVINKGESSTLSWTSGNADSIAIDQGIGSVAASGFLQVFPEQTTTYTITGSGKGGTAQGSVTVTVNIPQPPPESTSTIIIPVTSTTTSSPSGGGGGGGGGTVSTTTSAQLSTSSSTTTTTAVLPFANAGPDQEVGISVQVQLDGSASSDVDNDSLTYKWTIAAKPKNSNAVLSNANTVSPVITPDVAGIYKIQLVVNDGKSDSYPDTVKVIVYEAMNTMQVGSAGGTLQLGQFAFTIPFGLIPENETVETKVLQLPSMADEAAQQLTSTSFLPFGPSFKFDASFVSNVPLPLTLTYQVNDIPSGFEAPNIAILIQQTARKGSLGGSPAENPFQEMFSLLPAAVNVQEHTVGISTFGGSTFGGATFQLCALTKPLEVYEQSPPAQESFIENLFMSAAPWIKKQEINLAPESTPHFFVIVIDMPDAFTQQEKDTFKAKLLSGLEQAYQLLVVGEGFSAPSDIIYVEVRKIDGAWAQTSCDAEAVIEVDPYMFTPVDFYKIPGTMAHEFFHLIQYWNSNSASTGYKDGLFYAFPDNLWFMEGTAEWAADEVFPDYEYSAPTGERFKKPLNLKCENPAVKEEDELYETVVFFKWLEEKFPMAIQNIIEDHSAMTHSSITPSIKNRNTVGAFYLHSITNIYPDLSFLDFAKDALYWKDFAKNEIKETDLWGAEYLGPPEEVPEYFKNEPLTSLMLKKGGTGDGKDNAIFLNYYLAAHLSADVNVIKNGEGAEALSGMLHLKFKNLGNPAVKLAVISQDTKKEKIVTDLSSEPEITFPFRPKSQVFVIAVDSEWKLPEQDWPIGTFDVWVEPCGGEQTGETINVSTAQGMYDALEAASPGDTVKLAPGMYSLSFKNFSIPCNPWNTTFLATLVIPEGVTLAGSGAEMTTIILPYYSQPSKSESVWFLEGATLKDIEVVANNNGFGAGRICPVTGGVYRASLCNVVADFAYASNSGGDGFFLSPWYEGGDYLLQVYGTTLACSGCAQNDPWIWGIISSTSNDAQNVEIVIRDSVISGWGEGLHYANIAGSGYTSVDVDCACFSGNLHNVYEWTNGQGMLEHCPGQ